MPFILPHIVALFTIFHLAYHVAVVTNLQQRLYRQRKSRNIIHLHILCSGGLLSTLADFFLEVRRSVLGLFFTAFGNSELNLATIQEKCMCNPGF